jgi:hypothetical protein
MGFNSAFKGLIKKRQLHSCRLNILGCYTLSVGVTNILKYRSAFHLIIKQSKNSVFLNCLAVTLKARLSFRMSVTAYQST